MDSGDEDRIMTDTSGRTHAAGARADAKPVRLLLINPRFPESFWSFRWAMEAVLPGKRTLNPPLGLATLAALCPPDWDVTIVDENVTSLPLAPDADLIGVGGMAVQHPRQRELLRYYRRRGYRVIAGGSYASLCPERFEDLADVIVAGEAEYIWPRFCRDFVAGSTAGLYRETGSVDLADSPVPRFDLLPIDKYSTVGIQYSRGCPFRCDFCDIIVMFGRQPRSKRVEQIGAELDRLRALGVRNVFFVDDNLIGNKAAAKALLRYLIDYQDRHGYRFQFGTQASMNLAENEELMQLFRAANFAWVFLGIESPDVESLKETRKTQNLKQDLLGAVRTIYAHGIDVLGGFIVGFDNDTTETFERQYRFIVASGIQVAMVGLLTALPRTPLHARLAEEGRLVVAAQAGDNTKAASNIVPKRMTYAAMIAGYRSLYRRLVSNRAIAARIGNKARYLRRPVAQAAYTGRQQWHIGRRLFVHGVLRGGPLRWYQFARTLAVAHPRSWGQVCVDWIAGLSMREYARRWLATSRADAKARRLARRTVVRLHRWCDRARDNRGAGLRLRQSDDNVNVVLTLRGALDRRFLAYAARRLRKLLRKTTARVTVRVEELRTDQCHSVSRLLDRLSRHGDRVSVHLSEHVRALLPIDSSVFHLVLDDADLPSQA